MLGWMGPTVSENRPELCPVLPSGAGLSGKTEMHRPGGKGGTRSCVSPEMETVWQLSLFSETLMKPKTRDNLIYLAVGLSIVAFVAEQVFYSESHGRAVAKLSTFAFRAAGSMLVAGYFVGRAVRNLHVAPYRVILCVIAVSVLQLAMSFGFQQYIGQLSSMSYVTVAAIETFLLVKVTTWVVLRSHSRRRPKTDHGKLRQL